MAKVGVIEKKFKGDAKFNHLDPHMARFVVQPIEGVRAIGPVIIEPDMFPEDFELGMFDVEAEILFSVTITKKPPPKKKK